MIDDTTDFQRIRHRMRDVDVSVVLKFYMYDHDSVSDKQYVYRSGTDRTYKYRLLIQSTRCQFSCQQLCDRDGYLGQCCADDEYTHEQLTGERRKLTDVYSSRKRYRRMNRPV